MYKLIREKNLNWVMTHVPNLKDSSDLLGQDRKGKINNGSILFYIMPRICGRLLDNDPKKVLSKRSVNFRKKYIHKILIKLFPSFLNGKRLHLVKAAPIPNDRPIIFAPNHGFTEDTASTLIVAERPAYIVFGSLPQFFNTLNGVGAYLNGSLLVNRKVKSSRHASIPKAEYAIDLGSNLILFPEGVFNKTPDRLLIDFWSGIFRIAKSKKALIMPIVHLKVDNDIYSSRLEPFDVSSYSTEQCEEALDELRDIMASELYSLMLEYGASSREQILDGASSMNEACERIIGKQVSEAGKFYDYSIETTAAYNRNVPPSEIWENIANLTVTEENEEAVEHAKVYIREDYQKRF